MACQFTILFTQTPEHIIAIAKEQIGNIGEFEGDTAQGNFTIKEPVTIKGNYTITGQQLSVTITKKPRFFVSCKKIKKDLVKLINSAEGGSIAA